MSRVNNSSLADADAEPPFDMADMRLMAVIFGLLTLLGFVMNAVLLSYIIAKRLYRNFASSHFIGHLTFTNALACLILLPMFVAGLAIDDNIFVSRNIWCRMQGFLTSAFWAVIHYMIMCVAGVHLLTFARIHYDQLFGLKPGVICSLSWVIGAALSLPCITNADIVNYDSRFHQCVWGLSDNGYKFLTYLLLLGVLFPSLLTWYAYFRVLGILYHSPIVFQALGLYKSRFLVYGMVLSPLYQVPFFLVRTISNELEPNTLFPIFMFLTYLQCIVSPFLYGLSIFMMKEEDMALTNRVHKQTYHMPAIYPQADPV